MTAADVKQALCRRHPSGAGAWCCIEEAFSGFANHATGGVDLLAVGVWRSANAPGLPGAGKSGWEYVRIDGFSRRRRTGPDVRNAIVGYEVKVDRGDMRRELYGYQPGPTAKRRRSRPPWPGKAQAALDVVHYFLFATPKGLLHDDEIDRREPWGDDAPRRGALYLPAGVGLVEIGIAGTCQVRVPAELRDPRPWTRHETAELLRRASYTSYRRGIAAVAL